VGGDHLAIGQVADVLALLLDPGCDHAKADALVKAGKIDVTVDVRSVYSGSKGFDKHLQAADFFDAAKHPTMRFVSDKLVFQGDKLVEVPGQLTLLGQTHPVTLKANQFACYPNPLAKTEACGGDFEAVIDRTQWGMNAMVDMGMPKNVKITAGKKLSGTESFPVYVQKKHTV